MTKGLTQALHTGLRHVAVLAVAVASAAGMLVGCGSNDALQPGDGGFDDGQFVTVRDTGEMGAGRHGAQGIPVEEPEGSTVPIETTVTEQATVGSGESGFIGSGRYSITIPSGAVDLATEFKITQDPDNPQITCVLEPHATEFNTPVAVTFDLNGTDAYLHENVRAQWFDESTQRWRDVPSEWNPDTQILTGYFNHFCSGRAGW